MTDAKITKETWRVHFPVNQILFKLAMFQNSLIVRDEKDKNAPGGARTPDLRITSAPSAFHASTAYKYDAHTDCATGAG